MENFQSKWRLFLQLKGQVLFLGTKNFDFKMGCAPLFFVQIITLLIFVFELTHDTKRIN